MKTLPDYIIKNQFLNKLNERRSKRKMKKRKN
ncbi:hypothetical protein ZOSMA_57G00580 [Zostera marina]|uniref:Uncharacterized protein n=1 Tax=Zostera marina TaxID=29655 RepID=A0A0K9NXF2_ZOSMR|nr:hypothetical protein ZOSMA_57G00580 [Zostera marina]